MPRRRHRGTAPRGRTTGMLTDRGRAMLAAGMTLTICGVGLGFDDLVRIGALATLLPLLSLLTARRVRLDLQVRRIAHPTLTRAEQSASVHVRLSNHSSHPTPVLLAEERVGPGLGRRVRVVVPAIRGGRHWEFVYPIRPIRRGRHVVGPLHLYRRDVFGLAAATVVLPVVADLVALPRVHPLTGSSITTGTGVEGSTPTSVALHGGDDASLRGYQQGDDLRRIHWPVTAHRGELMVRHEGRPTVLRALIVIGGYAAPPVRAESDASAALDWMIEALASVSVHLAGAGYGLHVLTCETLEAATAPIRMSPTHALRTLAVVEPQAAGRTRSMSRSSAQLVDAAKELAGTGGVVVTAIGDHDEIMAREMLSLKGSATPGILFVLDTASFGASGAVPGFQAPDPRTTRAQELAWLARSGGWRVALVRRGESVSDLWWAMSADGRIGTAQ